MFLPVDCTSSRSSFQKANSRGKCIDVRLFVPRMVILYLKNFVRYGPLLRYNYLRKSDFGSTSISICSKFLASPKLNSASLTLAFFPLYNDMRFQTSKIVPLLWLPFCVTEIRRCLWTARCYIFVSRRSWRPLADWRSRLQYKVITYIRITLLQF